MLQSAFYEGTVRHRRFAVRPHAFRHRISMAYVDLEELPRLLGGRLVRRGPGLVRFRRADYLGDPQVGLADAVRDLVAQRTGTAPDGPIRLLTQLRTFGHCFNPVSFYYCHRADGTLQCVVAEVTSTPWSERHAYVLPAPPDGAGVIKGHFDKRLHVSPFMGMDQSYEWHATQPSPARPTLSVHIESREGGERVFDATLSLRRAPFTPRTLARVVGRHPAATLRVLALIYAHAAALALKRVPIHPRPTLPEAP
ncbi:DUF1365 domain-containing protein [Baekduia soli]|uniref:DUF1365 domain-containing protein n=1 Tax=Baekduia soli TaxID=496014 RepID=A0A5B8UD04_9ACTN|nr:DUF1365 domain-containing protein [Baekduia soli]